MKLPTPPGPHFSADQLVDVCTTRERLAVETEARAIHHLALLCRECWTAVDQLPALAVRTATSTTGAGLIRLKAAPAVLRELTATHRAAVARVRSRLLGFCHLLVEEAWLGDRKQLTSGAFGSLPYYWGPVLANGASLYAPREAHDLQAHLLTLFAHAYCYHGDLAGAAEAAALARAHVRRGRAEAEPAASVLPVEPGTNPRVRLDLNYELAVLEADDLFYQRLLGETYDGPDVAAIEQKVAEPHYWQDEDSPRAAERAQLLGKLAVFTDPERSQASFREAMGQYRRINEPQAAAKLLRELLYLWGRAADCRTPWVDLSFLVGLWDLPQDEPFFREIVAEVASALATLTLGERLAGKITQLRRAVRARSQRAAQAAQGGAER
jgi:hypothetical protein